MDAAPRRLTALATTILVLAATAAAAQADATPVGPLPKPSVTTVLTRHGSLVSIAVPARKASTGLVWRIARALNTKVVTQVGEADVGSSVVLVFKVVGSGKASIYLALTKGDTSPKAVAAVRYDIRAT